MISLISSYQALEYITMHIIIPEILITWIWVWKNKCKLDWMLKFVVIFLYMILLYICGFRRPPNYFLRYIITGMYFLLTLFSYMKVRSLPLHSRVSKYAWTRLSFYFFMISVLMLFCIQPINACIYKTKPINLDFPFRNGLYLINEGGDGKVSSIYNYHYTDPVHTAAGSNKSMRYAVDIDKLNSSGITSKIRFSKSLEDYEIFNEALYSPYNGIVVSIVDGYPNENMTSNDHPYNTGNTIILKSDNVYVLMGHLQKNSFTVKEGNKVKKGDLLAKIGNSGMTNRPHLHMQAMEGLSWAFEGVPIVFNGRFPVKNDIIIR